MHVKLAWETACVSRSVEQDSLLKKRERKAKTLIFLVKIQMAKYTTSTLLLETVCGITLAMNDFVSWW